MPSAMDAASAQSVIVNERRHVYTSLQVHNWTDSRLDFKCTLWHYRQQIVQLQNYCLLPLPESVDSAWLANSSCGVMCSMFWNPHMKEKKHKFHSRFFPKNNITFDVLQQSRNLQQSAGMLT